MSDMNESGMNEEQSVKKVFLQRLFPVSLSVLLMQLCTVISSMMVGNFVGSEALVVLSLVHPVYFIFTMVGALLSAGGSTLAAQRLGKNDERGVKLAFSVSFAALMLVSAAVILVWIFGLEHIPDVLGVPESYRDMAKAYLQAYLPGGIALMGIYFPFNYLKLMGAQKAVAGIFGCAAGLTALFGHIFINLMEMGIFGAGLAVTAGFWSAFAAGMTLLGKKGGAFRFGIKDFGLLASSGGKELLNILFIGSPSAANSFFNMLRSICMNRIVAAALGDAGLTSMNLILNAISFSMAVANGAGMTLAPFVGMFSGEKDNPGLRGIVKTALFAGLITMGIFAAVLFAAAPGFCAAFKVSESGLLAQGVTAIRRFAPSLLPMLINFVLISFYQSSGKTMLSNIITFARAFGFVSLFAFCLAKAGGGEPVWFAFLASEISALLLGLFLARSFSARKKHVSRILLLDTLHEEEGKFIFFDVPANNEGAAEGSRKITGFCEQNGLSPRLTMAMELAIEEILISFNNNAVSSEKNKKSGEDFNSIRVLISQEEVILRIRCMGKSYDPITAAAADDDLFSDAMGIKMILKMSKRMSYTYALGINNLTIFFEH
ncbi:MAG: hypothetical protein IJC39_03760 [Firmicutes bacterium]|nr:hypothetical protein [Bacillota bacterium]